LNLWITVLTVVISDKITEWLEGLNFYLSLGHL